MYVHVLTNVTRLLLHPLLHWLTPVVSKKMNPVSRETFLQQASFYSALSSARPDDKIVLIRLPKEMCAADLDGQSVDCADKIDTEEEKVIGKISVKLRSKTRGHHISRSASTTSINSTVSSKTSVPSSSYAIKSSHRNLKVNSLALTQPASSAAGLSLSASQQMRLGKGFDEFWSVNLGVEVEDTPMKKISKVVKKRAECPLVEQPKNLRMRLLPFSTPNL